MCPPRGPGRPGLTLLILFPLLCCQAGPSFAQLLHLDEIPWQAPADSTSQLALVVGADRFFDPRFDWTVNRLLLTVVLPGGEDGIFFVRMPHLTFDSGAEPAASRWPEILGEETPANWPSSSRVKSFGQLEVGSVSRVALPGLGGLQFGTALGLPVGVDKLYPFSSTSLPLRGELRKAVPVGRRWWIQARGGYLLNMDSGKSELSSDAFASGTHLGFDLAWYRGRGSRLLLTADLAERNGRRSRLVGLQWWGGWTDDGSLGIRVAKELEDGTDRPASWYLGLAWRFDSPAHRPGAAPVKPKR